MRSKTISEILLWVAIGVNGFIASTVAQLIWKKISTGADLQTNFEVAMRIVVISGPISILCALGLAAWTVLHITVHRAAGHTIHWALLILAAANIVAPIVLWFAAAWAMR